MSTDLEQRIKVLEEMVQLTMTVLLTMATPEERKRMQRMLGDIGRSHPTSSAIAQDCRKFVGELALRYAEEMQGGDRRVACTSGVAPKSN